MPKRAATLGRWTPTRSLLKIAPFVWTAGACAQIAGISGDYHESAAGRESAGTAGETTYESGGAGGTTSTASGAGMGGAAALAGMGGVVGITGSAGTGGSVGVAGAGGAGATSSGGSEPAGGASENSGSGGSGIGSPVCGNGVVEMGEDCDDYNKSSGDGCSGNCAIEAGYTCKSGSPSACFKPGPSCAGLEATCGPDGKQNCCASSVITGGTFNRDGDANYPATLSDFRLDTYEITVGRFAKFWAGYPADLPATGAGKNPNNASDTAGWDPTWNSTHLPAVQSDLTSAIECSGLYQTWGAGADDLPMNCIDWFEAAAFCIWDGGRLPTEAELNYGASGGADQRAYAWGSAVPDCTFANYEGADGGTDFCIVPGTGGTNLVGSESPKGDGKWGQADLGGNVWEWAEDWYDNYPKPCDNCSGSVDLSNRVLRGGSFARDKFELLSSARYNDDPSHHFYAYGARCARLP